MAFKEQIATSRLLALADACQDANAHDKHDLLVARIQATRIAFRSLNLREFVWFQHDAIRDLDAALERCELLLANGITLTVQIADDIRDPAGRLSIPPHLSDKTKRLFDAHIG